MRVFNLDDKKICISESATVLVQVGKGSKGSYKTEYTFYGHSFAQAVFYFNCINIGKGYKKRLIAPSLNKPLLARQFS